MSLRRVATLVGLAILLGAPGPVPAGAQEMPNPREMSGVPLPVADVPPGTVTVRVIRGSFANPVPSQTVEILGGPAPLRAITSEVGRAEFSGVPVGTRVKAVAAVAGERLESQEFVVPPKGGIRLILVVPDSNSGGAAPEGAPASGPAIPGSVVLGDESRFVFEIGEDGMSVFYILQILNRSNQAVEPTEPLVFDLPAAARSATILEGSSPQAAVAGGQMRIAGPLAPGPTLVQLAYTLPFSGSELVVNQNIPAPLAHLAVVAQKVGDLQLASPQLAEQRTMPAQGNLYIAGRGGAVPAGETLRLHFTNVPHHPTWPRNLAIGLAVLILAGGTWATVRAGGARAEKAAQRRQLETSRDRLFEELAALEVRHREQQIDPARYAERRRELVSALERLYIALDEEVAAGQAS